MMQRTEEKNVNSRSLQEFLSHRPNQNFGQASGTKRGLELFLSNDIQENSKTLSSQHSVMAAGNVETERG